MIFLGLSDDIASEALREPVERELEIILENRFVVCQEICEKIPFYRFCIDILKSFYDITVNQLFEKLRISDNDHLVLIPVLSDGEVSGYFRKDIAVAEGSYQAHVILLDMRILYETFLYLIASPVFSTEDNSKRIAYILGCSLSSRLRSEEQGRLLQFAVGLVAHTPLFEKFEMEAKSVFYLRLIDYIEGSNVDKTEASWMFRILTLMFVTHEVAHMIYHLSETARNNDRKSIEKLLEMQFDLEKHFVEDHPEFDGKGYIAELKDLRFNQFRTLISDLDIEEMMADFFAIRNAAFVDSLYDPLDARKTFLIRALYTTMMSLVFRMNDAKLRFLDYQEHAFIYSVDSHANIDEVTLEDRKEELRQSRERVAKIFNARINLGVWVSMDCCFHSIALSRNVEHNEILSDYNAVEMNLREKYTAYESKLWSIFHEDFLEFNAAYKLWLVGRNILENLGMPLSETLPMRNMDPFLDLLLGRFRKVHSSEGGEHRVRLDHDLD